MIKQWGKGKAPLTVVMISLNEEHNMKRILDNLYGFAQEVILLDSYSIDKTIDIALEYGIQVYQRKFINFSDQWNFAVNKIPIKTKWTMKIDPDETITDELKFNLLEAFDKDNADFFHLIEDCIFFQKKCLLNKH